MTMSVTPPHGTVAIDHPQRLHRPTRPLRHAIVIGAGMGGLIAAATLSRHFDQVVVFERDVLPATIADRKGIPQGPHVHGLLARGLRAYESAFPGFTADLEAHGVRALDAGTSIAWFQDGSLHVPTPIDSVAVLGTRALFEGVLRRRVESIANVTIQARTTVRGLAWNTSRDTVIGVHVVQSGVESPTVSYFPASLVVDASGRGSQLVTWLVEAGFPAPPTTEIPIGVRYMSRLFSRDAQQPSEPVGHVSVANPRSRRGGLALAVEGNRWLVTLSNRDGEFPPADLAGFTAYARSLPLPAIGNIVATATPLDDGTRYHIPTSNRRHFEQVSRFPAGILPFADSICAFTPVYGQGMTVAALEAEALEQCLAVDQGERFARFMASALPTIDNAWRLSCSGDLPMLMPFAQLPRKLRVMGRYMHHLHQAARTSTTVAAAFTNVVHLNAPISSLLQPGIVSRVLVERVRQRSHRTHRALGESQPAVVTGH